MNDDVATRLITLNREFYHQRAAEFDRSRQVDQPGFQDTIPFFPPTPLTVLDIGCGNGRYGAFLAKNQLLASYTGIDFAPALLQEAADRLADLSQPVLLFERDISDPAVLDDFGNFDLIVCLSAMHHLPQQHRRLHLLRKMGAHLIEGGQILLGNWQFTRSERQQRKIRPWSEIGLADEDVEPNDYLLTWQRGGLAYRYAAMIDEEQTAAMAEEAGLKIMGHFLADGREGDLNLYTILASDE